MDLPSRRILWRIVALIVGGIFIYAGVIKAVDPLRFAIDIDNYKMLPWAIGVRLAFYLPWLELVCGFALILRFFYRGGLFILTALTFIFIAASIIAKVRGLDITCGCFGHASKNWNFTTHLGLDFAILIALIALWISSRIRATTRIVGRRSRLPALFGSATGNGCPTKQFHLRSCRFDSPSRNCTGVRRLPFLQH